MRFSNCPLICRGCFPKSPCSPFCCSSSYALRSTSPSTSANMLCRHATSFCFEFFPKQLLPTRWLLVLWSEEARCTYEREWWGLCIKTKPDNQRFLTLSLIEHYRWSGKATTCMQRRCIVRKPDNQWCSHNIWQRFCLNQMLESKGYSSNKRKN